MCKLLHIFSLWENLWMGESNYSWSGYSSSSSFSTALSTISF